MRKIFLILAVTLGLTLSYARETVANISLLQWHEGTLLMRVDFLSDTRKVHTRLFKLTLNDQKLKLAFPTEKQNEYFKSLVEESSAEEQLIECVPIPNTDRLLLLYSIGSETAKESTGDVAQRRLFVASLNTEELAEIRLTDTSRYLLVAQKAGVQIDGEITPDIFDISLQGNDLILTLLTRFPDGVGTVSFVVAPDMNPISLAPAGGVLRHPTDSNLTLALSTPDEETQRTGLYELRTTSGEQAHVEQSLSSSEVRKARYAPSGDIVGYVRIASTGVHTIEAWLRASRTSKSLPLPWQVKSGATLYSGYYTEDFIFSPDSRLMAIPVRAYSKASRYEWHIWLWNVHTGQVDVLRLPFPEQSESE